MSYLWLSGFTGWQMFCFAVARYPIAFVSTSSLQPRSAFETSLYECLYDLCLYHLVHVRLMERNWRANNQGIDCWRAFMSKRTSLVSNVMHFVRHALHINLHLFVCFSISCFGSENGPGAGATAQETVEDDSRPRQPLIYLGRGSTRANKGGLCLGNYMIPVIL